MLEQLVSKAKKGSKKALVRLIMNEKDNYYRLAYVYLKNEQDALDALEDMIVILFSKIKTLQEKKKDMDCIHAPHYLEQRLNQSLSNKKKNNTKRWLSLGDGVTLYLDAVMLDDNVLTIFYRIDSENSNISDYSLSHIEVKGFLTNTYQQSSVGTVNDEETQISFIGQIENVSIFPKKLTLAGDIQIDEKVFPLKGSSISRKTANKSTFELRYDGIEKANKSITLAIDSLSMYKNIDQSFTLTDKEAQIITIQNEKIEILEIKEKNNETLIKVKTNENTALYNMSLLGELDYLRTEEGEYEKTKEGIFHTRTFVYKGIADSLTLDIGYMYYSQNIDKTIDIPIK